MAPFLTCQKKVVLQVKRKNKRSWRGFEAERVSGSDRSIQFQLTEKIVKYWGKKKTCVSIFPFFIFKVLLRIQQKYNIISQEFALFIYYKFFAYCGVVSDSNQGIRFFAQGGIHCFKEFFAQRPFTILKEWWDQITYFNFEKKYGPLL